ncbi:MAG: hypothetical protein KKF44_06690 [Nanoarchaeota archaeon]|nr:hypothetical protein [Nanoarchaeota archaeon]
MIEELPGHKAFRTQNGIELKSPSDLLDQLRSEGESFFNVHVTDNKNDFANWIQNALGDTILAFDLYSTKNFNKTIEILRKRLKFKDAFHDQTYHGLFSPLSMAGKYYNIYHFHFLDFNNVLSNHLYFSDKFDKEEVCGVLSNLSTNPTENKLDNIFCYDDKIMDFLSLDFNLSNHLGHADKKANSEVQDYEGYQNASAMFENQAILLSPEIDLKEIESVVHLDAEQSSIGQKNSADDTKSREITSKREKLLKTFETYNLIPKFRNMTFHLGITNLVRKAKYKVNEKLYKYKNKPKKIKW